MKGTKQGITIEPNSNLNSELNQNSDANYFDKDANILPLYFVDFVKAQGCKRVFEDGRDEVRIIKNHNKVVRFFNYKTETLSLLMNHIPDTICNHAMADQIIKKKATILKYWELVPSEPLLLHKDTKESIYIPFENGVAKITDKGVEMVDYSDDEIGFFMEVESLNHHFEPFDLDAQRQAGHFELFLIYAIIGRKADISELTADERKKINAFFSMVGYLISNYKDSTKSPAIILSDEGADDESRDGGRGKSLLTKAIRIVRKELFKGGDEFDPSYRHNYAGLEMYHDLLIADDVPARFNYDALYTQISEDITPERKGITGDTIKFEDTPKIVITTNWAVRYDKNATSTNRRFAEYKFTKYWSINNTPSDYFNSIFFTDWDVDEWTRFYQFLITCSAIFLRDGLQRIDYDKESDNFRAYFENDVKLQEFESVFETLKVRTSFTVGDFLEEYNKSNLRGERIFNHNNTRKHIDVYIDYYNLNFEYKQRGRKWHLKGDVSTDEDTKALPF